MQSHLGLGFQHMNFGGNEVQSIKVALTLMQGANGSVTSMRALQVGLD